jgi:iron complex outermembrane receptor protein
MANSRSLQQAVRLALATVSAAAGVSTLHAQTAPAEAQANAATPIQEVVVTGTRLRTPNEAAISPITTVSATDIQSTGLTRVEDILDNLPMVFAGQNSTVSNGSDGTATVDLRGLGPQRTLVLVNGRRLGPGLGDGRNFADINEVPASLIERVDILTGGASAVYGADAVAGVVNFVLNTHFQGVRIDGEYSFNQHNNSNGVSQYVTAAGDALPPSEVNTGFHKNLSILLGSNFADDKGNATFYATYDNQAAVLEKQYDYSACTLDAHAGAIPLKCGGSGTSAKNGAGGYFLGYANNAPTTPIGPYTVDGLTGQFRPYTTNDLYNYGPLNYFQRPNERWTAGSFVTYDVNSHVNVYTELMYSRNSTLAQIAPSGDFFLSSFIPCTDPLLTAQEQATLCPAGATSDQIYIGRRNVEGGPRIATFVSTSFRAVVGVKGDIDDAWRYDVYAQHGTVDGNNGNLNYLSNTNIQNALNVITGPALLANGKANPLAGQPECQSVYNGTDPACVPWNIWVPGGVTPAAVKYLSIPLLVEATTTEEVVSGSISGDLSKYGVKLPWAEEGLQVDVGAEWRGESAAFLPDLESQLGNAAGAGGPTNPVSGDYHVSELFTEVRLPLATNQPLAETLALEGGYRYSDYTVGFNTNTYKLGLEWAPVRDVRLRGSYQRAVRVPNINELYFPQAVLLDGTQDPCAFIGAPPPNAPTAAQCAFSGVSAAQYGHVAPNPAAQYNGLLGGNPKLSPETADTYSVGFVLQPRVVPNLTLSLDYFDIKLKGTIGALGGDTILLNCIQTGDPTFCNAVHRDAGGTLWRSPAGFVSDVNVNAGSLQTKGIDVKGSYRVALPKAGSLLFSLEGTRLNNLTSQPLTNGPTYDCVGYFGSICGASDPSWRHVLNMTWSTPWDAADIGLRWRYLGSASSEQTSSNPQLAGNALPLTSHIPAYNYLDLQGSFALGKIVRVQIGVNNIFDKDPPIIPTNGGGFGSDCPAIATGPAGSSCNGNTWPGTYDALGRYLFVHVSAQF